MKKRSHEIDMSKGSLFKNILLFTVPLIMGNILQLLYNAADVIVVSRWAGSNAMASVGATGSLNALIVNACIGISVGATVTVSRRFGAHDNEGVHRAVHTSILLAVLVGFLASITGFFVSKPLLEILGTPKGEVINGSILYMKIFFIGVPASLMYNFGASILRAVGDTRRPLYILAASGIVNVILNLILVIKFHMGVAGVAVATVVANYLSAITILIILTHDIAPYRITIKKLRFYKAELKETLSVGIPAALQSSVFALSNSVIQSAVNSFGTSAVAGSAAATNIEGFVYTSMNGFYQATITAVSQNYGAKNEKRLYKSIITCIGCVTIVGLALGGAMVMFARPLLGIYITDSPEAVDFAIIRMTVTALPYFMCGIMEVMSGVLRGLGYSSTAAVNSLIGACGLRLIWIIFVLPINRSVEFLFVCWPISWLTVITMHTIFYFIIRKKAINKMYTN